MESSNTHEVTEDISDNKKLSVLYALSKQKVYIPFFFAELVVTGIQT
jgi:hypothetical protein